MEKSLSVFDESGYNTFFVEALKSISIVGKFVKQIKAINGFKLNTGLLNDLLLRAGENALLAFLEETKRQFKEHDTNNKSALAARLEADKKAFNEVVASFKKPGAKVAELMSIVNGQVMITHAAMAKAKENFKR